MSTTDPSRARGQVLVLFAGGVVVLLMVAALAFDVGMMLVERRDQQNAADAAALAGGRYVLTAESYHGSCAAAPSSNEAVQAACKVALANGFDDSDSAEEVTIHIPPVNADHPQYRRMGFVEVDINASRPSIFGGILGRAVWPIGAYAIATNEQHMIFRFGMLALNPEACKAINISGNPGDTGNVNTWATIHSNSAGTEDGCGGIGFSRTGGSEVNVYGDDSYCRTASVTLLDRGSGFMTCEPEANAGALPDPLRFLPKPTTPAPARPMDQVGIDPDALDQNSYCPGSDTPPSTISIRTCVIGASVGGPGGATLYRGTKWILYPGWYPGGIEVTNEATAYLMPGVYYIGGGGFKTSGEGSVISIDTESDAETNTWSKDGPSAAGGVMIFNSYLLAPSDGGAIELGSRAATLKLESLPFDLPPSHADYDYRGIVIFQDRAVHTEVRLNGADSASEVTGIIYVPGGRIHLDGNGGTLSVDQVIADTFLINGNGGNINVYRDDGVDAVIVAAGLVE